MSLKTVRRREASLWHMFGRRKRRSALNALELMLDCGCIPWRHRSWTEAYEHKVQLVAIHAVDAASEAESASWASFVTLNQSATVSWLASVVYD
jgi:hypothetical protein